MSEANKTTMKQFFDRVYNQGDIAFLDELTAPDFVRPRPRQPDQRP